MTTVMITGGHKGLGLEAITAIAAKGGVDLLLAGRSLPEVDAVAKRLRDTYRINARSLLLDVSSTASTRQAAAQVKRLVASGEIAPLGVLMLNAGAQFLGTIQYSADGYEQTFATNCLGHCLLVNLLLDEMKQGGRIVFTASGTHDPATMDGKMVGIAAEPDATALANPCKNGKPISGGKRYATSKLCTILYAYELDRRLKAADVNIASIAFDPGLIPETGLMRSAPQFVQAITRSSSGKQVFKMMGVTMGSLHFSGASLANMAIEEAFAGASGKFMQSYNGKLIEARSSTASYDTGKAAKLWRDSEALVSLKPDERPERLSPAISRIAAE